MSTQTMAEARYLSVKVRNDVYRLCKAVSSYYGKDVQDWITEVLEPIAQEEFEKISDGLKKKKPPKPRE